VKIDNSVDPKRAAVTAAVMFVLVTSFVMGMSSPLASQGARGIGGIEGFTRLETFGDNAWVKVLVDPKSREVFSYQAQIVPADRVAVPAP